MKRVLCRKQSMGFGDKLQSEWWDVVNHIDQYVSRDEVAEATDIAIDRIRKAIEGKKAAFSWSGGKDSIVLAHLCQSVGMTKCQCLITDVEYPAWRHYLETHSPRGCEMVYVGFGLQYLQQHEEMVFPKGKTFQKWYKMVQQNHFVDYLKRANLDIVLLGHRTIDGNICGKDGFRYKKGIGTLYAPIYDWPHELLFAYIYYNGLNIPFIYKWKDGFYQGTHWWPARKAQSVEQGYRDVYDIDRSIVVNAALYLPSARKFLEGME